MAPQTPQPSPRPGFAGACLDHTLFTWTFTAVAAATVR